MPRRLFCFQDDSKSKKAELLEKLERRRMKVSAGVKKQMLNAQRSRSGFAKRGKTNQESRKAGTLGQREKL
jgi:hypothetical protein